MSHGRFPTFDQAKHDVLSYLRQAGWKVSPFGSAYGALKIPHATSPDGRLKLWFKAQAVHASPGEGTSLGDAHSLGTDLRQYDGPGFVAVIDSLRAKGLL